MMSSTKSAKNKKMGQLTSLGVFLDTNLGISIVAKQSCIFFMIYFENI